MATGPAVPGKPQVNLSPGVTGPLIDPEQARLQEEVRKQAPAPTLAEVMAEGETAPDSADIHQKAREASPETFEGKAALSLPPGREVRKMTGDEVLREVAEEKKAAQESETEPARSEQLTQAAESVRQDEEDRKKAAEDEARQAAELSRQVKAQAPAKPKATAEPPKATAAAPAKTPAKPDGK